MTLKQEHYIFGLLGIGAILVLVYLMHEKNGAVGPVAGSTPDAGVGNAFPQYPNSKPIKTGDITINGFAPDSLPNVPINGVQIPQVETEPDLSGGCSGCGSDTYCEDAGITVSTMKVPQRVLDAAVSNLQSFQQKRITFTQGY